jgi:hypothetical protein
MVANVFTELSLASNRRHVKEEKRVIFWCMATWSCQKNGVERREFQKAMSWFNDYGLVNKS